MRDRNELLRRYDAAVAAAVEMAGSMREWSPETRTAVAMTIRIIGKEFARTLTLALAASTPSPRDSQNNTRLCLSTRRPRSTGHWLRRLRFASCC